MAREESTLPPFESTLKGTASPVPNFSFNPGANVQSNIAEVALQRQQQQMQQNQQSHDSILKTVSMASQLAQSFVEASKRRQQRDAVTAYAEMQHNPALGAVLRADPAEAIKGIDRQNFPTTFQGMGVQALANGQPVNPQLAPVAQSLVKPKQTQSQRADYVLDGKGDPQPFNYEPGVNGQPGVIKDLNGVTIDPTRLSKPQPSAANANVREELGLQQARERFVKNVSPGMLSGNNAVKQAALTVMNSDNFLNQVARIKSGEVIGDKTTINALKLEAERTLAGTGQMSVEREKEFLPDTARGKVADIASWFTNDPQGRDQQAFLDNLVKEVKGQRDLKAKTVYQTIGPELAAAKLVRDKDPETWKSVVNGLGMDEKAAAKGQVKFLPAAKDLVFGPGDNTPQPAAPTDQAGWITMPSGVKYRIKKS